MTVVVATDLTEVCRHVTDVAAKVAAVAGEDVVLFHALAEPEQLRDLANVCGEDTRVAQTFGVKSRHVMETGGDVAARALTVVIDERASLLVLGADQVRLGKIVPRVLRSATTPVLVVRRPERLLLAGVAYPLPTMVVLALDETDDAVLAALSTASKLGDMSATFVHYRWLAEEKAGKRRDVLAAERDVRERLARLPAHIKIAAVRVEDGHGALDEHVVMLSRALASELIVCGSHHRHGYERLRDGSVAEGIATKATMSVLVAGPHGA